MRINRRHAVVLHDLAMMALSWELAWLARFNFSFPAPIYWEIHLRTLPVVLLIQGIIAWRFGLYRGLWRFASLQDLWNIIRAAAIGSLCVMVVLFLVSRLVDVPRSLLLLYPFFLVILLGGPRLAYRVWKDRSLNLSSMGSATRVLVVGAGRAGEAVTREILRDGTYVPVGLVDDRPELFNSRIHGVPVVGNVDQIPRLCKELEVDVIFLAVPSATDAQMQRIVAKCEESHTDFRTLPRLDDMVVGQVQLSAIRQVAIDDLLGREKVRLDWSRVQRRLSGKVVLISGGGGSIGSELCRQVARLAPAALVVFERSEYNLYRVDMDLRREFPHLKLHTVLGDVCDRQAVEHCLATYRPDVVFHAAAYKHVPILEGQAREAVRNNVLGTRTLAEAAGRQGCSAFVLISTDKAVNPSSVMGATKRAAEIVCGALNRIYATRYMTVRFGNVLGSAGSVVPLFQEQIRRGGPVTVTHPEISRYFMTIPEACQLILQAAAMGKGDEIFVLNMGDPVRIAYLAEQMIRLSGKLPGKDIAVKFTGLRPGEKLTEELFHADENLTSTSHKKILLAHQREQDPEQLAGILDQMSEACDRWDEDALKALLFELAPLHGDPDARDKVVALKRAN